MKILVTGGAGFMGSHLVDELLKQGHDVVVIDDLSGGFEENVPKDAVFVKGSIEDPNTVNKVMKDCEIVYHLAAYAAEGLSHFIKRFNYSNNLLGSINLINAAVNENVKAFVFTSSMAVYGTQKLPFSEDMIPHPEDSYGISKYAVEQELKICKELFGMEYVIIRPHNIYGERQNIGDPYRNVIGIFMNGIMKGLPPLIYGDGEQTRAFSYVGDIVKPLARAGFEKKAYGEIINLGAAKPYAVNTIAEEVLKVMKSKLKPIHVKERFEVKHAYCTTEKSEKILGFKDKTPLKEGLKRMADWAKKAGPRSSRSWDSYEIYKNIPPYWLDLQKGMLQK